MIKTIKISEDKELTISNNLAWATIYKDQFNHDIVPDIMPILSAILKLIGEIGPSRVKDLAKHSDALESALIELCSLQFVDFLNLVWALAKAYDDDVEAPEKWVRQFDEFPLDIIAPAVLEVMAKGLVSSKNLKSLQENLKAQ